jgi:sRNA-binding regulator protein Hfq
MDRKIEGSLESIDKYRICVKIDDKEHFFYKHAIIGYHVKK